MEIVTVARCALVAAVLAAGCDAGRSTPADTSTDALDDALDGDTVDGTLAVYALDPATGPVTGGTPVGVSGRGFVDGATVELGAALAASVTVVSPGLITLVTPLAAEAGAVDVTVQNPGGASSTLVAGFTYTEVATDRPIGWCNLQYPTATGTAAGVPTESIYGRVWVEGCTEGAARCEDLVAELGYGDPAIDPSATPSSYEWQPAVYNPGHTDDDNDEYSTSLDPLADGTYSYVFRFSTDTGEHFTYCDLDGNDGSAGGFSTDRMGTLAVADRVIGWCNLQHPATTTTTAGTGTESIYGRVWVEGCTDGAAMCGGILGAAGMGSPGSDPSSFVWSADASYNPGHTADDNDEYQVSFAPPSAGTFEYAYRFSGDGGDTWTYCDLDGSTDGYDTADAGVLTVE